MIKGLPLPRVLLDQLLPDPESDSPLPSQTSSTPAPSHPSQETTSEDQWLHLLRLSWEHRPRLAKFIPNKVRVAVGTTFRDELLRAAADPSSVPNHCRVHLFPLVLHFTPKKGSRNKSKSVRWVDSILANLEAWKKDAGGFVAWVLNQELPPSPPAAFDHRKSRLRACKAKVEDGNLGAGLRILTSSAVVSPSSASAAQLETLHPTPRAALNSARDLPDDVHPIKIHPRELEEQLRKFRTGSAAGPDGLSPDHLKDLIKGAGTAIKEDLLLALASFGDIAMKGQTPPAIAPFLGAS